MIEIVSRSEEETLAAGKDIAASLRAGDVVHLHGDLGAGKTTLVRGIAAALGVKSEEVASPTFAIVHEYPLSNGELLTHLDCYRISDEPREWEEIGIPDILANRDIKLIEWPKEGFDVYAPATATITLVIEANQSRTIRFERR
jgi:tRNA threonylcarbamoyladenosine biosynthesis protein TsaE